MQKHTKNYFDSMGFVPGDWIPCEVCGAEAVDIHHITSRSLGGSDEPENLIALCRVKEGEKGCHDKAACGELTKEYLCKVAVKRTRERNGCFSETIG